MEKWGTDMWSAIDSPFGTLKRRQPSRGVVFRRSIVWRKGRGEVGFEGRGVGRVEITIRLSVSGGESSGSRIMSGQGKKGGRAMPFLTLFYGPWLVEGGSGGCCVHFGSARCWL